MLANETTADTEQRLDALKPAWPNPAIVVGLPKAGTQSIADYFECGCYKVSHYNGCHPERKKEALLHFVARLLMTVSLLVLIHYLIQEIGMYMLNSTLHSLEGFASIRK